jgi:hypothetical protein
VCVCVCSYLCVRSLPRACILSSSFKFVLFTFSHFISDPTPSLRFYVISFPLICSFFLFVSPRITHSFTISSLYIIIAGGTLLNLLSKFATCVSDGVDGKGSTDGGVEMNDLYGGARISYIFNEVRMCTLALHPPIFMFLHPLHFHLPMHTLKHSDMNCCAHRSSYFINALTEISHTPPHNPPYTYTSLTPTHTYTSLIS